VRLNRDGDDEHHQQQQHYVDQGGHVDLAHGEDSAAAIKVTCTSRA
jgi:hypothetical protein